jgi:monofunctional biosynthetic peptidoglycan transglycosylase
MLTIRKHKRHKCQRQPIRNYLKRLIKNIVFLLVFLIASLVATISLLNFVDPPTWSWRLQRDFNPPDGYPENTQHLWCDIEEIPIVVQLAVVASEDQNFPDHSGLDFEAIEKALVESGQGKALRGASTITQQTVKNLFLWQRKDWSRKLVEGGVSLLLELLWDKQRILEVYLNIVEFGPGVYGVCAASNYWYRLPIDQLSSNQAARLAAILPNPWLYRAEPPSPYVSERATWIEQQMNKLGYAWLMSVNER